MRAKSNCYCNHHLMALPDKKKKKKKTNPLNQRVMLHFATWDNLNHNCSSYFISGKITRREDDTLLMILICLKKLIYDF